MPTYRSFFSAFVFCTQVLLLAFSAALAANDDASTRQELDFNFDWKFSLGAQSGAQAPEFDDSSWRELRLPHDWSIEAEYSQENTAGATGYLPGGLGWYRKHFATPELANGEVAKTQILFDGIYNHSEVWINGHSLGYRPFGYVAFYYDLTPFLNTDGSDNVIAVHVDRSRYVDSRWYTGSGIYRNVKLVITGQVHVPIWGSTILTPEVTSERAKVLISTELRNDSAQARVLNVSTTLVDGSGLNIGRDMKRLEIGARSTELLRQEVIVTNPQLWDIDNPNLYFAQTEVRGEGQLLDSKSTRLGIRSLRNDAKTGFFLNGRNVKIKGVNLHHDAGLVGAAVPLGVWKRRLEALKEAGVNAIRTGHKPASKEFIELCDEMGFLVQQETFDEWERPKNKRRNGRHQGEIDYIEQGYSEFFTEWAEKDLTAIIRRDINNPSIFQWSIGNEIEWSYPRYIPATGYFGKNGKSKGATHKEPPITPEQSKAVFNSFKVEEPTLAGTAQRLSKWLRAVDTSRPVTTNMILPSVSLHSGYADAVDIAGFSYRRPIYDYARRHYPDKMVMGTENFVQWAEWEAVLDRPFVAGIFVWTGIDYLGEVEGRWPSKGAPSGMLDFAGFKKPSYHMMKSIWSEEPHVYMTTADLDDSIYRVEDNQVVEETEGQWKWRNWGWHDVNTHWNYSPGQDIVVEVYTNQAEVELFLNGKSQGVQRLVNNDDHILKWAVAYEPGELKATSVVTGVDAGTSLRSSLEPAAVVLSVDRKRLDADSYDVAHITAQVVDKNGVAVTTQERKLTFDIDPKLQSLGVDNGAKDNLQPHKSNEITTRNGRALLIVQTKANVGDATINVRADGLKGAELGLNIEAISVLNRKP